jgi:hypothetical protein
VTWIEVLQILVYCTGLLCVMYSISVFLARCWQYIYITWKFGNIQHSKVPSSITEYYNICWLLKYQVFMKYTLFISFFVTFYCARGYLLLCFYHWNRVNLIALDYVVFTVITKKSNPIADLDRPWGFQEVEAPRFQDSRHMKVVRLSALCTGRLYPPGNIPGTHFC